MNAKLIATLLVTSSMASEKYDPLCVGEAKNPRWPRVLGKKLRVPISCGNSKNGWMNANLFGTWLSDFNAKITRAKTTYLMLFNNCPAHIWFRDKYDGVNTNLCVMMLPKNTTANLQPCDQG